MAKINNNLEYINTMIKESPESIIKKSEQRYTSILSRITDKITDHKGHEIVMLAGPSASGKTTTAMKIREQLNSRGLNAYTVSLDNFYMNQDQSPRFSDGTPDFETVHALDLPLIKECLNCLVHDGKTELPLFDFYTGRRISKTEKIELEPNDVIIVEGLHALNPLITDNVPKENLLKLYVSVSSRIYASNGKIVLNKRNLRFIRRLVRDYKFRSSSVDNTYMLWTNVQRGEDKYLFPFKGLADILINSIHIYEPCIFRDIAISMLSNLDSDNPNYKDSQRIIRNLMRFEQLSTELVPSDSLLREFIG